MGWVNHRQHHVDGLRQRLPRLSDLERAVYRRDQTEDVGRGADSGLRITCPCSAQKLGQHLRLAAAVLTRENLLRQALVRLGEADVIELYLAEAHPDRFVPDAKVVLPDLVRVRVHPAQPLLVAPW